MPPTSEGGAKFGYTLVWVVAASNLMGMLIQALSAKLGIATGMNLAELCREHYPRWLTYTMWVLIEVVAIPTRGMLSGSPSAVGQLLPAATTEVPAPAAP